MTDKQHKWILAHTTRMYEKTITITLQRKVRNREDHSQKAPHQLVNQDKTMEKWEEGTNQVDSLEDKTHRELCELFVHHDYLSEVDMEEGFVIIEWIHDGGFKRRVVTNHDKSGDIISKSKQRRGWEEAEEYNSDEEEVNNKWEAIGPWMKDFGDIGPDKEDWRVECQFGEDGLGHDHALFARTF